MVLQVSKNKEQRLRFLCESKCQMDGVEVLEAVKKIKPEILW
jgi:hypothetical protein